MHRVGWVECSDAHSAEGRRPDRRAGGRAIRGGLVYRPFPLISGCLDFRMLLRALQ